MSRVDAAAVAAALRDVPGVASAVVQPLPGEPEVAGNLRVVLRLGADPYGVADSVIDLLDARFGLGIDGIPHRPAPPPGRPRLRLMRSLPPDPPPFRPQVEEVRVEQGAGGTIVAVTLVVGPRRSTGTVRGATAVEGVARAAADAAARALAELRGDPVAAQVRELGPAEAGAGVRVVLTGADGSPRDGVAPLLGELPEAVVAAVLDAAEQDEPPRWWHRWVFRQSAGGSLGG